MYRNIIFSDYIPNNYSGLYANYSSTDKDIINLNFIDISKQICAFETLWITQLDSWHSKLSQNIENKTWLWWFMPGSRITTLGYPYNLRPLFFSLGVINFLKTRDNIDLLIVGLPIEAIQYIEEWNYKLNEKENFYLYNKTKNIFKFNFKNYKYIISALKYYLLLTFNSLIQPKNNKDKIDLMVFSIMLNPNIISNEGDHYFGKIFDEKELKNSKKIQWFYLSTNYKFVKKSFYNSDIVNRDITFNFKWISSLDLIKILYTLVKLKYSLSKATKKLPNLSIDSFDSAFFTNNFIKQTVLNYIPVKEVALYLAFKNYIHKKKPNTVIYPYEQKPIERALLQVCKESKYPIKTIAYAHAIYNNGHRYVFNFKHLFKPYPDYLATTGPASLNWFVNKVGWDANKIISIGSPRFKHIENNNNQQDFTTNKLKILLLISFPYELENMAKWCELTPTLFNNCELIIRKHPYAWYKEQEHALRRIKKLGIHLIDSSKNLNDEINWSDLCLFCSTSAGIEAMLIKKLVIRVGLDDIFNINPLIDKEGGSNIMIANDPFQLKQKIIQINKMKISEIVSILESQYLFANKIYSKFSIDKILTLLNK